MKCVTIDIIIKWYIMNVTLTTQYNDRQYTVCSLSTCVDYTFIEILENNDTVPWTLMLYKKQSHLKLPQPSTSDQSWGSRPIKATQ